MTPERYQQITELYTATLALQPGQRAGFLDRACGDDQELRREVESLLALESDAQNFLSTPAAGAAAKLLAEETTRSAVGRRLGPYQILSELGAGGMGEVYLAEDGRLGRHVALKLLGRSYTEDSEQVRRFRQEARAVSAFNHPNIVTIYDVGQEEDAHFIATEYIEGQTMRQRLAQSAMTVREVLDVAVQVAGALSVAHAAGIIHRDIKPENIMLRPDGLVKVLDFGLAKLTERREAAAPDRWLTDSNVDTEPGIVLGTVNYMSPEQARGLPVDARTDVFSLGVVLYEAVAGHKPFAGATATDVLVAVLERDPPPLQSYLPDVPAEFERIVTKAMRKDREERYQTIKDLLLDLKALRQELETKPGRGPGRVSGGIAVATTGGRAAVFDTGAGLKADTGRGRPPASSTGQYLVSALRRRKKGAALLLALLLVGAAGFYSFKSPASPEAIDSLAVLPFANASADPEADFLSDGITESLINSLSQLPDVKVLARTTAFRYKGKDVDPQAAGRELRVDAVLTGRVFQQGDSLLVQADLVDVADNSQLWGERYSRKLVDILSVQEEIARQISERLRVKLTGEQRKLLAKQYTANTEAYQAYLKGRYWWNKRTKEGFDNAIEYFNQAIGIDPDYALAYAGLADCHTGLSDVGVLAPAQAYPKAREAVTRALAIDNQLAEAHSSLAFIMYRYDWEWAGAERGFRRAIELNPNYATAHRWYSLYLSSLGRHAEAIATNRRAQELDPLSLAINRNLGHAYYRARQYDRAIEQLTETLRIDPTFGSAYQYLGMAYEQKGMYQQAIAAYLSGRDISGDAVLSRLGHAYAVTGRRAEAERILEQLKELSTRRYVLPYDMVLVHIGLGDKDEAFRWLEKAYEERDNALVYLKVEPQLDSLRGDPRFADLLRRVGLGP